MMGSRVRVTQAAPAISTPSPRSSKASQLPFSDCPAATRSPNCDPRELTIVAWRRAADAGSVRGQCHRDITVSGRKIRHRFAAVTFVWRIPGYHAYGPDNRLLPAASSTLRGLGGNRIE